ncbi:MAG: hypothetical protein HZC15_04200 [Candidatus Omnitrophica bacterium]|nr:hypothetical protein [Candidatus Omnitrophota bacterium]
MKRKFLVFKIPIYFVLCLFFAGCISTPKGFLKPSEGYLANRQLQMRQYDTKSDKEILSAVAGVLQDLGFVLDNSETDVGFVAASKKADAVDKGQVAGAVLLDILVGGNNTSRCDKSQVVKASVITQPSLDGKRIVVRVTFQRIVWNMTNQISRVETINDPEIYQKFYVSLSKAIFLEDQKI